MLDELQSLAHELRVDKQVRFTGFLSQAGLREQFYESHIFLHPSELGGDGNQEGVPNSMLEAMASGLPVFATKHGGIPEAIENGVSGVLVEERDQDALARALLDWTRRPEALAPLAQQGALAVAIKFEQRAQARALATFVLRDIFRIAPQGPAISVSAASRPSPRASGATTLRLGSRTLPKRDGARD